MRSESRCGLAAQLGYTSRLHAAKELLQQIARMEVGLRRSWESDQVRSRHAKRVDGLTTSLTLNIAEGNGRFSKIDHRKFIGLAEDAGTKLAAYMDLLAPMALVDVEPVKDYLRDVMAMLSGLRGYLDG